MNEAELESIVTRLRKLESDDDRYEVKACARELSKDIRLSSNELYSLSNSAVVTGSDRVAVLGASMDDLDSSVYTQAFAKAQQLMPRSMRGAEDDETRLRRLGFVNSDGTVSKAGLLTAGCYPQQFFPKLLVDVAVHVGEGKGETPECRFADRTLCVGVLGDIISDAVTAVSKNLRRSSVVSGAGRLDELEIPVEVVREAVANALIHRDYDSRFDGETVAVDIYDNRVEVVNPGGLWGKSKDELADGRSMCRNPSLMTLMSITPMPLGAGSPAEGNGTGIPLMVNECLRRGLKQPTFCPSFDHFKVILWRPTLGEEVRAEEKATERPMSDGPALTIEEALGVYGELSTHEIAKLTKLSPSQVRYRLRKLLDSSTVVATATTTSRNRKYRLK